MVAPLAPDDARTIGPYHLLGQLGRGGLGHVFLGRSASGETVAVKVIRPELAGDPWFRDQFRTEVAAARKVGGAFVTPVVDADLDGDVPWLAAAYIDGPTLAEAIRERGPVPAQALLMLASGLAGGLAAIHAAGVVHGNLHPSNVLLAEDGPRVADFGIARAAVASGLPGADYGSPGFLSPEQALGDDAGPPSDIFSFGALLTFACTGHGPFGSGTSAALMYRLVNSPADLGELPGELRSLVGTCLAKQPGNRPAAGRLLAEFGALGSREDGLPGPMVAAAGAEPRALALAGVSAMARTSAAAGPSAGTGLAAGTEPSGDEPWPGRGRGRRRSRRRESRPSAAAWIAGGLLTVSAAVIVVMTGAVPLSSAGQSQPHGGAALAGSAPTSQALNSGSSPSASAGSSPSASRTGYSGGITPSVQQGPSASAFLTPAPPSVPPGSPAAASPAPRTSASASKSPSKSASPSPSPSPSSSPSPSPSCSAPSSPSPSSSAPSSPPPSSSAPSSPPPSSSAPSSPPPSSSAPSSSPPSSSAPSSAPPASP